MATGALAASSHAGYVHPAEPRVASGGDHRMAMALVVAGLVADGETVVEDTACVATSFPQFVETLNGLAGGPAVTVEA